MPRYIDADALLNKVEQYFAGLPIVVHHDMVEYIENAPTADVRENVHAKWLREPNCFYRCSECGKHYPSICDNMDFRICPNCGAEMSE